jgi:branched-chain amino acid transport system ATP-binding protein
VVAVRAAEGDVMAIIETAGVVKHFGAVTAAADLTVRVDEGTVIGLIGGNGAGKTTFLNMLTGYLKPDRGTIRYDGRDITKLAPRDVTRLGMCRSFQIPQLFGSLTVRENLLVALGVVVTNARSWQSGVTVSGDRVDAAADATLEQFGLQEWRDREAAVLPEGVRKLLDIAMALVVKPKVLLLDEPTSGVSADEKFAIMDRVMTAVRAERVTILFVEHDMDIVRRYAGRVLAFYEGRIIADGEPEVVLNDDEVRRYVVGTIHAAAVAKRMGKVAHAAD